MNYEQLINSDPVVLVEFYATWCPHCQRMEPIVEQVKELTAGQAKIYQIDVDRNRDAANYETVQATPTFVLYKNGNRIWRFEGEINGEVLLNKVESA